MGEGPLNVVFGTGQVGVTLAARLAAQDVAVRAVWRHRRGYWPTVSTGGPRTPPTPKPPPTRPRAQQ